MNARTMPIDEALEKAIELLREEYGPASLGDFQQALEYYLARAPEHLAAPERWPDPAESPVQFERRTMSMPDMPGTPAVSNVRIVDSEALGDGGNGPELIGTDMRQGVVFRGRFDGNGALSTVASIPHPAHVTVADVRYLDSDGMSLPAISEDDLARWRMIQSNLS